MYISKKYVHRVYTIVYFPGIPPKTSQVCLRVGSSAGLQGKKTWLRRFFANLPPKPSNWMVGTTENQHDTMSTGLSQKESTGLSQPYNSIYSMYVFPGNIHIRIHIYISFGRGHDNLRGGKKCVANLFHSQPIALSEKKPWWFQW